MHPILKNSIAVILGWFVGSLVNMGLIQTGNTLIPYPNIDPSNMDALSEIMPTLDFKYFIFPFLAHALGTLVGALIAGLIAANHKMKFAISIGVLFLIGGILINYLLQGPLWFTLVDILIAYIPMAWIGGNIALKYDNSL
jgi:hypothetical protein